MPPALLLTADLTASSMQECADAHVGGHITLLFSVHSSDERVDWQGSRGAGICVKAGVRVKLTTKRGHGAVSVTFPFSESSDDCEDIYHRVVAEAAELFELPEQLDLHFSVQSDLPFGQGFGCSAAGALAASAALLRCCGRSDGLRESLMIAHRVERSLSSGLGDVAALAAGGVELRVHAGLPLEPAPGVVLGWQSQAPILLCWSSTGGHHTSGYIDDDDWKKAISAAGDGCVDRLIETDWTSAAWSSLLDEADIFAVESGLLEDAGRTRLLANVQGLLAQQRMQDDWGVRLCMLGASAVVVPRAVDSPVGGLGELCAALPARGLEGCLTSIASGTMLLHSR